MFLACEHAMLIVLQIFIYCQLFSNLKCLKVSYLQILGPLSSLHFFFFFGLFRAAPMACGCSQARGQIGAVAAGLRRSNMGSEPHL